MLRRVVQYTEPVAMVQTVCDHPAQIIALQKQIMDLQSQWFLPPECDHSTLEQQLEALRHNLEQARRTPKMVGTEGDLQQQLDNMTWDSRQLGEAVQALRMQLANALSFVARAAPTPPQQLEDRGQKVPDSTNFSTSDRTQLNGWIAELRMVIRHKPTSFQDRKSKMLYAFNRRTGVTLGFTMPHDREDRTIGLGDLPAIVQLLEAAFGDPDRVATA